MGLIENRPNSHDIKPMQGGLLGIFQTALVF